MTPSSVLRDAWSAIGAESVEIDGIYQRRVFADSKFKLYACILQPGDRPRVCVEVSNRCGTDGLDRETGGFRVHRQHDPSSQSTRISFDLNQLAFRELFEIMAIDVLEHILPTTSEADAIRQMRARLDHWERFMRCAGPDGLSEEAQCGLFGELTFLHTLLAAGVGPHMTLDWWKGPESENQDFRAGLAGVEVKTTTTNLGTQARIANEFQLDFFEADPLFLFHLWLRDADGAGKTLPMLVSQIRDLLGPETEKFRDRLVEAGYHEVHQRLYEKRGYVERKRRYYAVQEDFPCIARADLRSGVSKVEYTIELSGFERFLRSESIAIDALVTAAAAP